MSEWFVTIEISQGMMIDADSREEAEKLALECFDITSIDSEPYVSESWSYDDE